MQLMLRTTINLIVLATLGCSGTMQSEVDYSVYGDWRSSEYILPYPVGSACVVVQGNHSPRHGDWTSHHGPWAYAYDFLMPIGSPITAARSGTVSYVIDEYSDNDKHTPGNAVTITHADNTVAVYGHLTRNGSLVKVGDRVEQGQVFALSGNSGPSEDPHLHFHVSPNINVLNDESLPVTFRNTNPNPRGLERGERYPALAY